MRQDKLNNIPNTLALVCGDVFYLPFLSSRHFYIRYFNDRRATVKQPLSIRLTAVELLLNNRLTTVNDRLSFVYQSLNHRWTRKENIRYYKKLYRKGIKRLITIFCEVAGITNYFMNGDPLHKEALLLQITHFVRSDISFLKQKWIARWGWLEKPLPNSINEANPWTWVPVYDIIGTTVRNTYLT